MVKKRIIFTLSLLLLVIISVNANGTLEKPEWHKGDFWLYDFDGTRESGSYTGIEEVKVEHKTTIEVNENKYSAWIIVETTNLYGEGETSDIKYDTTRYYRESDNSLIKEIYEDPIEGQFEVEYNPPATLFDYPIQVGKEWEYHSTITYKTSNDYSLGSYTHYFKCTRETDVNTNAGFFHCFVVKSWSEGEEAEKEGDYYLNYYSNDAGPIPVVVESYNNNERDFRKELFNFSYSSGSDNSLIDNDTPGFEICIIIGGIAITLLLLRRKK